MGELILRVKEADGEKTIEKDSTGRLELITEYDRHFVNEALRRRLCARTRGFSIPLHAAGGARRPAFSWEEAQALRLWR
jgi:hypothetical protein